MEFNTQQNTMDSLRPLGVNDPRNRSITVAPSCPAETFDMCTDPEQNNGINCFLCQRLFTDIDELQKHLQIHNVEVDLTSAPTFYNCNICGRQLRSEQELQQHHQRYHQIRKEAESSLECPKCQNIYVSQNSLQKHMELEHSNKHSAEKRLFGVQYRVEPKKRYPPRSQYFNPNLLFDCDAYIQ